MLHSWHYLPLGLANLLIAHYIRTVFTTSNIPMPRNIKSLNKSPLCWQTIEFGKQQNLPNKNLAWLEQRTPCAQLNVTNKLYPILPLGFSTSWFLHYPYVYNLYCVVSVWAVVSLNTTLTLLYTLLSFVFLFCFVVFFFVFFFFLFFVFVFCFVFVFFCFFLFFHTKVCTIKAKAT